MLDWSPSRIRRSLLKVVFKGRIVPGQRSCVQDPLKYLTNNGLDFTGTDAPTHITQINKVENQNKKLAINVFSGTKTLSFTGSASSMRRSDGLIHCQSKRLHQGKVPQSAAI